jgi:ABC-2 type transport system permease protein
MSMACRPSPASPTRSRSGSPPRMRRLAAVVGRGIVSGPELRTLVSTTGIGFGTLLPVLGILSVTGEWRHRTALTTFALEPRRLRVLAAKCLPPLVMAVAASLFAILVAVPVTAVVAHVRGVPATWEVAPLALPGWTAANVLVVAMGLPWACCC